MPVASSEQGVPLRRGDYTIVVMRGHSQGSSVAQDALAQGRRVLTTRALPVGLTSLVVLLGVTVFVTETWARRVGRQGLDRWYTGGGILAMMLVAGGAGWSIIQGAPKFMAAAGWAGSGVESTALSDQARAALYSQWFIAMRWVAVLLTGVLVVTVVGLLGWLPGEVWWPLCLGVAGLATCNVLYQFLRQGERSASRVLTAQPYVDLVLLAGMVHFSGGVENPLFAMMVFHVIFGGLVLPRRHCYGLALTGSVLLAMVFWGESAGVLRHYSLQAYPHMERNGIVLHPVHNTLFVTLMTALQTVILLLAAYYVSTLAVCLRGLEQRLEATAEKATADRRLLEKALETTRLGLRVVDVAGRAKWVSRLWREWWAGGVAGAEPVASVVGANEAVAGEASIRVQEQIVGNPGSLAGERVMQVTQAPLLDGLGRVSLVFELAQDITEEKRRQAQLMRAGELAAVGELAGEVAHEVNNPIAIIGAKARLLLSDHREAMSGKVAEELGKIALLTDRVAKIAQGLLAYSRPALGQREAVDVRFPVRQALALIEDPARSGGVQVEDGLGARPVVVHANAEELAQVFLNLFLNALDAMPQGGTLRVRASRGKLRERGQACVNIAVEDSGCGIPPEVREKIFEPFFTTKTDGHGTGLGLAICQGLVRSQGGEIRVESEVNRGACFVVSLPMPAGEEEKAGGHV